MRLLCSISTKQGFPFSAKKAKLYPIKPSIVGKHIG